MAKLNDNDSAFLKLLEHYYGGDKSLSKTEKPDFKYTDRSGNVIVIETKRSKPNVFDYLNLFTYKITSKPLFKSKKGVLGFDADTSEFLFLEDGTSTAVSHKIRKNNLQWLMCEEVFDVAPDACSLADLSNEYEARAYFNKDKPNEDDEYKIFINTRKRVNETTLLNLRIENAIDYSGRDYMVNRVYLPNRDK